MHPPGFLNARSPEKENQRRFQLAFTVAVFGPGFASTNPEAKTMFDLSWTKQIDWINSLNLNCPMFFFLNVWILYDFVGCWWLDLDWKFNSTWLVVKSTSKRSDFIMNVKF